MYEQLIIAAIAIIFFNVFMPCLSSIGDLFQSAINKIITKWQLELELDKAEASAAAEVIQPAQSATNAIGFVVPNDENDEYEFEDKSIDKPTIGFRGN